jgi:hypothetical protein
MTGWQETLASECGDISTVVTGTFADQAALFGMLCRIRDRGFVLVSVEYLGPAGPDPGAGKPDQEGRLDPQEPRSRQQNRYNKEEP